MRARKDLDKIVRNLNKQIAGVKDRTMAGLLAGGLIVQGASQRLVPVEYGLMRASAYTRRSETNPQAVEVGYSAKYALFVHENLEMKLQGKPRPSGIGVYWGPNGTSQFLTIAVEQNTDNVVNAVAQYARIPE